jgi:hypothetical protein
MMNSSLFRPYPEFRYIHPPRPEIKAPPKAIKTYERMGFWGQPKLNGSCGLGFIKPGKTKVMGRHQESFKRQIIPMEDFQRIHQGNGWMVLTGEYMNKSQRGLDGKVLNGCFCIFDILVYGGQYLIGSTFEERQDLLDTLYSLTPYDPFMDKVSNNIYRVKNFKTNFEPVYNQLITIDMYEGWVLKKPKGVLETGYRPNNNTGWQLKMRKPTKNYRY